MYHLFAVTYRIVKAVLRIVVFAFKQAQTGDIAVKLDFLLDTLVTRGKSLHFRVVQNSLVNVLTASGDCVATHKLGDEPLLCHDYVHEICVECVFGDIIVHADFTESIALTDYSAVSLLNVC